MLCPLRCPGRPGLWMLSPSRPRLTHAEGWVLPQPDRDPADPITHDVVFRDLVRREGHLTNGPFDSTAAEVAAISAVAGLTGDHERR